MSCCRSTELERSTAGDVAPSRVVKELYMHMSVHKAATYVRPWLRHAYTWR